MKWERIVWMGVVVVCLLAVARAGQEQETYSPEEAVGRLNSEDLWERERGAREILEARERTINLLLAAAREEQGEGKRYHNQKHLAIILLGKLRPTQPDVHYFLVDNITYLGVGPSETMNILEGVPCAHALDRIGMPSLRTVFKRVTDKSTDEELKLYGSVIAHIMGHEPGQVRVAKEFEHARGRQKEGMARLKEIYDNEEYR